MESQPAADGAADEIIELPAPVVIDDPDSPLFSALDYSNPTFGMEKAEYDCLRPGIRSSLDNIRRAALEMGYKKMFPIQATSIPHILMEKHVIGQAPGGAGKTAAFTIGMLAHIDTSKSCTQGLVIGMTRELSRQIYHDAVVPLGKNLDGFTHDLFLKGFRTEHYQRSTCNAHVIVGSPGKLFDLIHDRKFIDISQLRVFVLDEADELILDTDGHGAVVKKNIFTLRRLAPKTCLTLLFSATFPPDVRKQSSALLTTARRIEHLAIPTANLMPRNRKQYSIPTTAELSKIDILGQTYDFCGAEGKSIVFCNTIKAVTDVAKVMEMRQRPCGILHGELRDEERDLALDTFRGKIPRRECNVLICTDVLARGVDVPNVGLVVNYDLPVKKQGGRSGGGIVVADEPTYLHRIARCARAGKKGQVINLVNNAGDQELLTKYLDYVLRDEPADSPARAYAVIHPWLATDLGELSADAF